MKATFRRFILLLFLAVIIVSCEKKDDPGGPVTYPQKLYLYYIAPKSDVRMFVKNGEIKDPSTIDHYVYYDNSFFSSLQNPIADTGSFIEFRTPDTARFSGISLLFHVHRQDDLFLMLYPEPWVDVPYPVLYKMLKYRAQLILVPCGPNLATYRTYEMRVAHGNYHELEMSCLVYKYSRGSNTLCTGYLLNEFDESCVSELYSNDTLAIQEFGMMCIEK